jgi:hypothetical protein
MSNQGGLGSLLLIALVILVVFIILLIIISQYLGWEIGLASATIVLLLAYLALNKKKKPQ